MKIVLASSSKRRLDLLAQMNIIVDIVFNPDIDEREKKKENPRNLALRLAEEKALCAQKEYPDEMIISGDTVVIMGGKSMPKVSEVDEAVKYVNKISGRRVRVVTAICVALKEKRITKYAQSTIHFKRLTKNEIDTYINSNEWVDKTCAINVQGMMGCFIKQNMGSPIFNVIGLPLYETYSILSNFGFKLK